MSVSYTNGAMVTGSGKLLVFGGDCWALGISNNEYAATEAGATSGVHQDGQAGGSMSPSSQSRYGRHTRELEWWHGAKLLERRGYEVESLALGHTHAFILAKKTRRKIEAL